jgi:hypothetical protein
MNTSLHTLPVAPIGVHLLVVSADAWGLHRQACEVAIAAVVREGQPRLVVIDRAVAHLQLPAVSDPPARPLDPSRWLRRETEGYRTDTPVLTHIVRGWASQDTVLIDTQAFSQAVTRRWLEQVRQLLFDQAQWPRAVVLVCRSPDVQQAIDDLAASFYLVPKGLSAGESNAFVKRRCGNARWTRWMLLTPGLGRGWLAWVLRWSNRWDNWRDKDARDAVL